MDYDAIVIGSGFGGAIVGCRLAEAGYKVLILERGRRWSHDKEHADFFPRKLDEPERWLWSESRPETSHGWLDLRVFPNMAVAQGAGVGGGSLIYANISVAAPPESFRDAPGLSPWPRAVADWHAELKPYSDRVAEFMKVRQVPRGQWSARTHLMKEAAEAIGQGHRFRTVPLAVRFDDDLSFDPTSPNPLEPNPRSIQVNEHGVKQGACYHCGMCDIGCDVNARNTLDTNYIPRAERQGAEVRPLHLVTDIGPVPGGYRVVFDRLRDGRRHPGSQSARLVVLAAGSLGSTELLLRCRDHSRSLRAISPHLGRSWSSNGDFLTPAFYPVRAVAPAPWNGPPITGAIDFLDRSEAGQSFWVQDGGFPDLMAQYVRQVGAAAKGLRAWLMLDAVRYMVRNEESAPDDLVGRFRRKHPVNHVMPWFGQAVDAGDGVLSLRRPWWIFGRNRLHLAWNVAKSRPAIDALVTMHRRLSEATGGKPHVPTSYSWFGDLITPHPLGGCGMGDSPSNGVVDHEGRVFGHPGLYVADAAIIPRALGVNPSRTIAALAERIAALIVRRGR